MKRKIKVKDLLAGDFAFVVDASGHKTAILGLSKMSFMATVKDCANVVNIANGIGSYPDFDECRPVSRKEALEFVLGLK